MRDTLEDIVICFGYPEDARAWFWNVPAWIELVFILAMTQIHRYRHRHTI